MIPCKECLILPICKQKESSIAIDECKILHDWYWHKSKVFEVYLNKFIVIEKTFRRR